MNTRILVLLSLFVGIGLVLHYIVPPLLFGMKPDMSLAMLFLGIILFPKIRYVLLLAFLTGFVSALTTSFPMGEFINMVEKPMTALIFLALLMLVKRFIKDTLQATLLTAIGTIVSGSIFLTIGLYIVGLEIGGGFIALFAANVLPATLLNTMIMILIYPVVSGMVKRSELAYIP